MDPSLIPVYSPALGLQFSRPGASTNPSSQKPHPRMSNDDVRYRMSNSVILNDINDACNAFSLSTSLEDGEPQTPIVRCKALFNKLQNNYNSLLDCIKERAVGFTPNSTGDDNSPVRQNAKSIEQLNDNVRKALATFSQTCEEMEHQLKFINVLNNELCAARQNSQRTNVNIDAINWDGSMRNSMLGQTRRYTDSVESFRHAISGLLTRQPVIPQPTFDNPNPHTSAAQFFQSNPSLDINSISGVRPMHGHFN